MHRMVVGMMPKGAVVDHINGDTLDNRRENLRIVDQTINNRNRVGAQKNSTTGHLGVSPHKDGGFVAVIRHGGTCRYLGCFDALEDAVRARVEAEKRMWGVEPRRAKALGVA